MKIRITVEGSQRFTARLDDTLSARAFASLLPLKLTLVDYGKAEKIGDLPRRLPTEGEPAGYRPVAGDLTYYAPWGNLALFHADFRYSEGLVCLGKMDCEVEFLRDSGPLNLLLERIDG
jgi:hypothetical protein